MTSSTTTDIRPVRTPPGIALVAAGVGVAVVLLIIAALSPHPGPLTPLKAIVLGLVEGITEFLPISSTGHLLVVQRLLGLTGTAGDQAADDLRHRDPGRRHPRRHRPVPPPHRRARQRAGRARRRRPPAARDAARSRSLPAAIVGVVARRHDQGAPLRPVAGRGRLDRRRRRSCCGGGPDAGAPDDRHRLELTATRSSSGASQLLALWPGTSRSLVTIVAARGPSVPTMTAAVEFSFLLGLVTLGAATAFDLVKHGGELVDVYGWITPVARCSPSRSWRRSSPIRWMLAYLQTPPLSIFGWYRLGVAAIGARAARRRRL